MKNILHYSLYIILKEEHNPKKYNNINSFYTYNFFLILSSIHLVYYIFLI